MISLNNRGDTIVEVLLAITILTIVIASIFVTTSEAQKVGISSQERSVATRYAEEQFELIQAITDIDYTEHTTALNRLTDDVGRSNQCLALLTPFGIEELNFGISEEELDVRYEIKRGTVGYFGAGSGNCTRDIYDIRTTYLGNSTFRVEVTWEEVGSGNTQMLTFVKRINQND